MRPRYLALASIAGLLLTFAAFAPGLMSQDSIAQLTEARSGVFSDWHPPLMAELWRGLDAIWPGPAGILLFHCSIFWVGLGVLIWAVNATPWICAAAFLPPVFALLGAIWKDVGMGASLLFAVAMLLLAERRPRRSAPLIAASLAFFYASAVRHNAAVATLPLCLWTGAIFAERIAGATKATPRSPRLHALANGLALFLGVTLLAAGANVALTARETYPVQQILLHDLAAVSLDQGQLFFPSSLRPPEILSVTDLGPLYSASEVVPLYGNGPDHFPMLTDAKSVAELKQAWLETIPSHPRSYFKHRFRVFQQLLGIKRREVCLPYQDGTLPNTLGVENPTNAFHRAVMAYLGVFRNTILFRGWAYFLLSWAFVAMLANRAILRRRWPAREEAAAWAVGASGALYVSTGFFVAPTCDFRMYWWTVLAVLIFPLLLPERDRLRLRYRFLPDLKSLVTREIKGVQPVGRRLCLFAHYDPANRVSDAVAFYVRSLQELRLEVQFISTNEALPESEVAKILPYCSKILLRKNVGIDFGSWRVGLSRVSLKGYEQLVLANDSVFGPLQPLGPIFEKMKEHDLWGMSDSSEGGSLHLQSYFLVFGPKAFESAPFRAFWDGFRFYLRKSSYIRHGEIGLSKAARAAGWKLGAFVSARAAAERALADPDFSQFRGHLASGRALNPTLFLWDVLIRDFGFPFLKAELPRLNRLKMANLVAWRKVVAAASSYDPELIERALGERRSGPES